MYNYLQVGAYFPTTYWPVTFVYWPIMTPTVQASDNETYLVPFEDRYFQVFSECPKFYVPEEVRIWNGLNG